MAMIIMKKINATKKHQIEDLDANSFPTELRNDPRVCKKIPLCKQNLYIRSTVCRVMKFEESDVFLIIMIVNKSLATPIVHVFKNSLYSPHKVLKINANK